MSISTRKLITVSIAGALALMVFFGLRMFTGSSTDNELMPDLNGNALISLSGENIVLLDSASNIFDESNFAGRVYLLEFFQAACDDCRQKEKQLKEVSSSLMKKPFEIIYIHDGNSMTFADFQQIADRKSYRLYDENGAFAKALGITRFPAEFLIDHEGIIRAVSVGRKSEEDLLLTKSQIDSLVNLVPIISEIEKKIN